ncbi:uncharacterized protein YbjT (DUF2867 family) [Nocardia sp. GAS34]|uniref:NAD(P)H-binding protein n=1 Tax=unclassified Nocardia TaxID=2637762 RepID=UPI003D2003D0
MTGAAGGVAGISRLVVDKLLGHGASVRAMVHTDDARADALRTLGADVVVGDLTNPADVAAAAESADRVFFNMSVSTQYVEATAVVCSVLRMNPDLQVLVNMSQMTVSQMTATSTDESHQQRLQWLAEQVVDWSTLPAVHIRPTILLENPLFTMFAAQSVRDHDTLALPFGKGKTSPVAADDVAAVVATVLLDSNPHVGKVYELTGPETLDLDQLAQRYTRALGRTIVAETPSESEWSARMDAEPLPPHVRQHLETMARLHRDDRYNRSTDTVEQLTGRRAQTVDDYLRAHRDMFGDKR